MQWIKWECCFLVISLQEQSVQGVYRIAADANEMKLVVDDFDRPNGLAFSPDESLLYIGDSSGRRHVRVFTVAFDGSLTNGHVFVDMNVDDEGVPDGMKVDIGGNLYCTGPAGVWVVAPNGEHLGTIRTPEQPSNCAFGGEDYKTLFITACSSLYSIRVNIEGQR